MAHIEKTIMIQASSEAIDKFAIQGQTWPQWFVGVEATHSDATFPEKGGQIRVNYRSNGVPMELVMTVDDIVHGDHLHVSMTGMLTGTQRWQYKPVANGTQLSVTFDYKVAGGGLGAIADALIIERINANNLEQSLNNLKKLTEA